MEKQCEMDVEEICWEDMNRIDMAQNSGRWGDGWKVVMNYLVA
jgi:hypothetical protein